MDNKNVQQVSWNLSESIIFEIAGLLNEASSMQTKEDYRGTFLRMKAIRIRISPYLQEELEIFKKTEMMIYGLLRFQQRRGLNKESAEIKKGRLNLMVSLDDYCERVMAAMKKYGLLIPPKEDKTKMNA